MCYMVLLLKHVLTGWSLTQVSGVIAERLLLQWRWKAVFIVIMISVDTFSLVVASFVPCDFFVCSLCSLFYVGLLCVHVLCCRLLSTFTIIRRFTAALGNLGLWRSLEKAGMVHYVSGWTRGVQVKLWDPLRTRAIPERLRGVFTTRRYTNPRLPLPYLEILDIHSMSWLLTFVHKGHAVLNLGTEDRIGPCLCVLVLM